MYANVSFFVKPHEIVHRAGIRCYKIVLLLNNIKKKVRKLRFTDYLYG